LKLLIFFYHTHPQISALAQN